ncbi:MAG: hypothetical protein U0R80_07715 [Nocardioidaceae bacterium]
MDDPVFRWLVAFMLTGVPGLFRLAQGFYPGNRRERRADFEKHYRCRVPEALGPELDRRLALPDRLFGAVAVLATPVVAMVPVRVLDPEMALAFIPVLAMFLHQGTAAVIHAVGPRRPLSAPLSGVARLRTMTVDHFIPTRLRLVTRVTGLAAGVMTLVSIISLADERMHELAVFALTTGVAVLPAALLLELTCRRMASVTEPGGDDQEAFVSDALRSEELNLAHQEVATAASLGIGMSGVVAAAYDVDKTGLALLFLVALLVLPVVIWAARRDRTRFVDRLWAGQVPTGLALPSPTPEAAS